MDENEFLTVLDHLYEKTLILQDPGLFNKVLYFYLIDSLAHIDYTAGYLRVQYHLAEKHHGR